MIPVARRRVRTSRIARLVLGLGLVGAMLGATASAATAGGWWTWPRIDDGSSVLGVGQTATVSAHIMFPSVAEAEAVVTDEHPYHAFLVRGVDDAALREAMTQMAPGDWWQEPALAIRLAPLSFHDRDANLVDVTATFTVPAVEPGVYDLMLCDADCSTPLADVIPAQGIYVLEASAVELIRANDETFEAIAGELEGVRTTVEALEADIGGAIGTLEDRLDEVRSDIAATDTSVHALRHELDGAPRPRGTWPTWTGWAVAAVVLAFATRRSRRSRQRADGVPQAAHRTVHAVERQPAHGIRDHRRGRVEVARPSQHPPDRRPDGALGQDRQAERADVGR